MAKKKINKAKISKLRDAIKKQIQNLNPLQIKKGGWFRIDGVKDEVKLLFISERAFDDKTKRFELLKYFTECEDEDLEKQFHFIEFLGGEKLTVSLSTGSPNECPPGVVCDPPGEEESE